VTSSPPGNSGSGLEGQQTEITDLLHDLPQRGGEVMERLFPLVYDSLRRIAHRALQVERADHTLGTTGLVHEAYLKLVDQTRIQYRDRAHFFAIAARAMRQILVDYARHHRARKRGGGRAANLDAGEVALDQRAEILLALDEALDRLASLDPRLGQVVECRFFGGLSEEETAEVVGVTTRTVRRDWTKAKGWLREQLSA
jgi:RNA polymerase sigma factor (TIGR02999 family)